MTEKYKRGSREICGVLGCSNSRRKIHMWRNSHCEEHTLLHKDCPCLEPYQLHPGPKCEEKRKEWVKALNRKDTPKHIIVCSEHFIDRRPTELNPTPKLKLGYDVHVKHGRKLPKIRLQIKKRKIEEVMQDEEQALDYDNDPASNDDDQNIHPPEPLATEEPIMADASTQYEDISIQHHDYSKLSGLCNSRTKHIQTENIITANKLVQCNIDGETSVAKKKIKTDTDALFMAGVTFTAFWTIVATLSKLNSFNFTMHLEDQVLLVLMRLRQDLEIGMLARMFDVSDSYVSKVISAWIPVMAKELGKLVVWLPRETIAATLPHSFINSFNKTTCIIDCAETFIQRPTNLKDRAETYSFYKGHNTAKYLVGISPNGLIMFISRSYGGRASDKYIVNDCGFLDYLRPGDEIMADRGFTIDEELFVRKVKLTLPSFTKGKKQLSNSDVTSTRRIANVRIHVERAIRRLKVFRILSGTVPVASLHKFDEILIVCAALVNLRPELVKDRDCA